MAISYMHEHVAELNTFLLWEAATTGLEMTCLHNDGTHLKGGESNHLRSSKEPFAAKRFISKQGTWMLNKAYIRQGRWSHILGIASFLWPSKQGCNSNLRTQGHKIH